MLNNYLINPAVAGIEHYADIKLASRVQWTQVDGRPESLYFTAFTPFFISSKGRRNARMRNLRGDQNMPSHHGIGVKILADRTGAYRRNYASLSYAYHLRLDRKWNLALGLAGGRVQHRVDRTNIDIQNNFDPLLADNNLTESRLDLSAGLWLYSKAFYFGVSGLQLLDTEPRFLTVTEEVNQVAPGNYFLTIGYRWLLDDNTMLTPSFLLKKAAGDSWTGDAALKAIFYERFWLGAGLRNYQSLLAYAGISITPNLDISYAYDQGVSGISRFGMNSHEILIGFKLANPQKVYCPQWSW